MNTTPQEALRLARAGALLQKHATGRVLKDPRVIDPGYTLSTEAAAAMLDEAMADKDKTIAALRQEIRDADREARDAFHEGRADEAERNRNEQNW